MHTGSPLEQIWQVCPYCATPVQRDDVQDAMRWLGDITLFGTPVFPHALDLVILGARVASAAGDAGLRARVLQATEALERRMVEESLREHQGSWAAAARALKMDRANLARLAKRATPSSRARSRSPLLPTLSPPPRSRPNMPRTTRSSRSSAA